jgi:hypothetical protein
MKTFESYHQSPTGSDEANHLEILAGIEREVKEEIDAFLLGCEELPDINHMYPITSIRGEWNRFVNSKRKSWADKIEAHPKIPVAFKVENNPLKAVGEVKLTMDLLGKAYLDIKGRQSYEKIVKRFIDENPSQAAHVYVPHYFSPETKAEIDQMRLLSNMGMI